jgi:hypothetical protein
MPNNVTAEQTINGAFGDLQILNLETVDANNVVQSNNAIILANTQSVEARVTVERRDLKLAGSRRTLYKSIGASGEGSFTIFRVSSEFMNLGVDALSPGNRLVSLGGNRPVSSGLQLIVSLRDPEIAGSTITDPKDEEIILAGVKIWEIPFGFSVDDLVQQTIPFTFESMLLTSGKVLA